jgi:hypothetical protein
MPQRRKTEIVQVNLRLREDLRQRLWRVAEKSGRSFNQEIVRRLEESFRHEGADAVFDAIARAHDERNKELQTTIAEQQATLAEQRAMSKSIDAKLEKLTWLTELLNAGIKK